LAEESLWQRQWAPRQVTFTLKKEGSPFTWNDILGNGPVGKNLIFPFFSTGGWDFGPRPGAPNGLPPWRERESKKNKKKIAQWALSVPPQ